MNLRDLLLQKHHSANAPLENFVYRQQDAVPFCPAMWHEELFVAKVLSGSCTLFADGRQSQLNQGDVFVLPPFTLYALQNQRDLCLECALANLRVLQNNKNTLNYPQSENMDCVITPQSDLYPQIHQALLQLSIDKNMAHMCLIDIQNILHWLHHKTPVKNITADKQLFAMKNVLNVVHTQTQQLVVKQLAEDCGYSEFYLMKLFKKFVGVSCIDYAIGYKLTQIALALLAKEESFCHLSCDVGFANVSYCNRQFKKMFGVTPKEFRKRHKQQTL